VAGGSLLHVAAGGSQYLEAEEVRGLALVKDDEDLSKHTVSLNGLQQDYLVDLSFEKLSLGFRHGVTGCRSGARKLTVERNTTSLRWL